MLKPVIAGLAITCLCLSLIADASAQTKTKKKSAVVPAEAQDEAPPPPNRTKKNADSDDDVPQKPSANSGKSGKSGKPTRPEPLQLVIEPVPPELEKVLQDWERNTSKFKKLTGDFAVFKYDPTFETEKRGVGKFAHEAPDKGNYELKGAEIPKGEKSKKKNSQGEPYALQSESPVRWVCSGKEIIRIDEKEKTFEKIPIPADAQGQNIIEGPLPFLFGMKAEQAKYRYKMTLKKQNEDEIWLEVIPRRRADVSNWIKATVIIDAKRFIPIAVQLFNPTESYTVHKFSNVKINPKDWPWDKDPFAPNLRSYRAAVTSDSQSAATTPKSQAGKAPAAGDAKIQTVGGPDAPTRKGTAAK
jgi:TIGR03009 family protein